VFLVEDDGVVVGRLSLARDIHPASRHVADLGLMVAASHRRRGIGRALLARALQLDVTHVVLGPTPDSIPFYRRLGFELRPALKDRVYYLPAGTGGP
jgi:GNAT superfamily N-acetyltransferase